MTELGFFLAFDWVCCDEAAADAASPFLDRQRTPSLVGVRGHEGRALLLALRRCLEHPLTLRGTVKDLIAYEPSACSSGTRVQGVRRYRYL